MIVAIRRALAGRKERVPRDAGFSLPELLIGLAVMGFVMTVGASGLAQYREATSTTRAIRTIRADVMLARSLAIRSRSPVSLVARESLRTYVIRDALGTVFQQRVFDETSDLALTSLDVATAGDSLTFDARGILLTGGTPQVDVTRRGRARSVVFNALGRSRIN